MTRSGGGRRVSDRQLSDLVSVGMLMRVFPPDLVDEVIVATGRTEQRNRSLPARVMAYFAIAMGLSSGGSYEDVMSLVTDGLSWACGWQARFATPSRSAIFQARVRLGPEPLQALFGRVATPLGRPGSCGAWLADRRLVSVDGGCLTVPNTPVNAAFFGRCDGPRDQSPALPHARLVAVAECGTQVIFDAGVAAGTRTEADLVAEVVRRLQPGMLLLADHRLYSFALMRTAIAAGADVLWRISTDLPLERRRSLDDASWLALIRPAGDGKIKPITVRVIDHCFDGCRDTSQSHRLVTTMLDTVSAPASELAAAYLQRWRIDLAFDELKTHAAGPGLVLRSRSPELVLQEIWGHLCCSYAIRASMTSSRPLL